MSDIQVLAPWSGQAGTSLTSPNTNVPQIGDIVIAMLDGTNSGAGSSIPTTPGNNLTPIAGTPVVGSAGSPAGKGAMYWRILDASDFALGLTNVSAANSGLWSSIRLQVMYLRHPKGFDANAVAAIYTDNAGFTANQNQTLNGSPIVPITRDNITVLLWGSTTAQSTLTISWDAATANARAPYFDDGTGIDSTGYTDPRRATTTADTHHYGTNTGLAQADWNQYAAGTKASSFAINVGASSSHAIIAVTFQVADKVTGSQVTHRSTPQAGSVPVVRLGAQVAEHDHPAHGVTSGGPLVGGQVAEHDHPQAGVAYTGILIVGGQVTERDHPVPGGYIYATYDEALDPITATHYRIGTLLLRAKKLNVSDAGDVRISLLQGTTEVVGPTSWTPLTDAFADYTLDCSGYTPSDPTTLQIRYAFRRTINGSLEPAVSFIKLDHEAWAVTATMPRGGTVTTIVLGGQVQEHDHPQGGLNPQVVPGSQVREHTTAISGPRMGQRVTVLIHPAAGTAQTGSLKPGPPPYRGKLTDRGIRRGKVIRP